MLPKLPRPVVPAAFFSMVLGIAGLGHAWRRAHQVWDVSPLVGETLMAMAASLWCLLLILYLAKWWWARQLAMEETRHPVQCCFIGLIGVATMLVAGAVLPYHRRCAELLFLAGALFTWGFAAWRTGLMWRGERDEATNTAVLYLPTVAGGFVTASLLGALGYREWGQLAFGAGAFSWLAIESVLLHRMYCSPALTAALRPTMGIQLAPPAVGLVAYLSVNQGAPDILAYGMFGYALLQGLILLRMARWIASAPSVASFWAFSFGLTALAAAPLGMIEHGAGLASPAAVLAPYIFGVVNVLLLLLFLATLRLLFRGQLLPLGAAPARA